jgi:lipopolysaccharide transport system ATP-binding protein
MPDILVSAQGVSKKFCRNFRRSLWYGLKDIGADLAGRSSHQDRLRAGEFWAVDDVSFDLARGDCLGLVGRNGAGKTSLLRMLNGLIRPDRGRIEMRGSVGALIALGAGIKPVLTGRENIYCMAALRGMSRREAARKVDDIVAFAELEDFIDSPMQSYSSGMRVRLSFAVASALEPDILLLDEVLAVGDAAFRDKCYHRIAEVRRNAAVIFVSHNMEQVARVSSSALVLDKGRVLHLGDVDEGIVRYGEKNAEAPGVESFVSVHPPVLAFEAKPARSELSSGESLVIDMDIQCSAALDGFQLKVMLYNARGEFAADGIVAAAEPLAPGLNRLQASLHSIPLRNGNYRVAINLIDPVGDLVAWSYKQHAITIRGAYSGALADCQLKVALRPCSP